MSVHADLTGTDIHVPITYTYATATARLAATGFFAADVGKFAKQTDTNSIYMLTAITPAWQFIGGVSPLFSRCTTTTTYTNNTTLSTPTGMSAISLVAGKTYRVRGQVFVASTTNGGISLALTPTTLTASSARIGSTATYVGVAASYNAITALPTLLSTNIQADEITFSGIITVGVAGSIALQTSQFASHSDTTTVYYGSWLEFEEVI